MRTATPSHKSPKNPHARAYAAWQAGQAYAKRGAWPEAIRSFETATRQAPNDAVFALNLARSLLAVRRVDEAAQEAARAYNIDRRSSVACALTAHCLMEGKRFRDAARCL